MATVTKTFAFAANAEGLTEQATSSAVAFAFVSGDGNPSGSISFTDTTKGDNSTEGAIQAAAGQTWQTWGVPAGAAVTGVQLTGWSVKTAANTKMTSATMTLYVMANDGTTVIATLNGSGYSYSTTVGGWSAGTTGSNQSVGAAYQDATTNIRFRVTCNIVTTTGGGTASVDVRADQIALTITYIPNAKAVSGAASFQGVLTWPDATTVTDDFNDGTIAAQWIDSGDPTMALAESGGTLNITTVINTGSHVRRLRTNRLYNLVGTQVTVKVVNAPTASTFVDTQLVLYNSDNNNLTMIVEGTTLYFYYANTGALVSASPASITYDAVAHLYWRIRESGGTVYYDTSPDGTTWTNRSTVSLATLGWTPNAVQIWLSCGTWGSAPATYTAQYDDVNILPSGNAQNCAGVLSLAGAATRRANTAKSGGLPLAGATLKNTLRALAGSTTFTGALTGVKLALQALAGSLSFSGSAVGRMQKNLTGSLALAGAVGRQITRGLAGAVSFAGTIQNQTARLLAGAVSLAGMIQNRTARTLAGGVSFAGSAAGTLTSAVAVVIAWVQANIPAPLSFSQSVAGSLDFAGGSNQQVGRLLAGAVNAAGLALRSARRTITGAVSGAGTVQTVLQRMLAGGLSLAGTALHTVQKQLAGLIGPSGAATRQIQTIRARALMTAGLLVRQTRRGLAAILDFSATTGGSKLVGMFYQTLTAVLAFSSALSRQNNHRLAGSFTPVGSLARQARRLLAGSLALVGSLARRTQQLLTATVMTAGTLAAFGRKVLRGMLAPAGALTRRISHSLTGSLSTAGQMAGQLPSGAIALASKFKGMWRGLQKGR